MSMECAYCAAIILICLNLFLIFVIGSVNVDSMFFIDEIYVVPLAPAASTMSGAIFQPFVMMLFMSGWYFVIFLSKVSVANLSLQYVKSMNCMVRSGVRVYGGGWLYGWPMMHNMSGLSLALQWHLWVSHVPFVAMLGLYFLVVGHFVFLHSLMCSTLMYGVKQ